MLAYRERVVGRVFCVVDRKKRIPRKRMFGVTPECSFCFCVNNVGQMTALGRSYQNAKKQALIALSHERGA